MNEEKLGSSGESSDVLSIETLFAQAATDAERAALLNRKAIDVEGTDPAHMLELARRAREYAACSGDREAWAYSCRHAGIAHHLLAHKTEALEDLQLALEQFELLDHKEGIAMVAGNLAVVHQNAGRLGIALECQLRCLKLCDDLGDEQGKARNLLNTAEIYCALEEHERALEYCEQSLTIARKWNDLHTQGTALAHIGTIYARLGEVDRALSCQQESLAIKEETGNTLGIAIGLSNIAALRAARNEPDHALGMYELSLQLRQEIGDQRGVAILLRNVGEVHARRGKHDRALEYALRALALANELHLHTLQETIHRDCAELYEASGNVYAAFHHLKNAVSLREYGIDRAHIKHVAALELGYDRERERDAYDRLLRRVYDLEHLALRSQVNPHFLYNALNSIQFFLTSNDRESAHRYLSMLGRLMRASLENVQASLIPLSAEIETVRLYLQLERLRFGDRVAHVIDIDQALCAEEILVPPMVLQPFVENAVGHAILPRASAGKLWVSVHPAEDDTMVCVIEDDGIGREERARQLAKRDGESRQHTSLGMNLITDRLALLSERTGKRLSIAVHDLYTPHGEAAGTRVELVLPMSLCMEDLR